MANYVPYNPEKYSLLDTPEFQSSFSGQQAQPEQAAKDPMLSPDVARAAAYGAQSGGLSGALTSAGITSMLSNGASAGGPYAVAGGLILSQIEAAQKAKAQQEAERIANEKQRMQNTREAYRRMGQMSFGV